MTTENKSPIVGIDLGTTHSLVSIWHEGRAQLIPNALGEVLTPSVVSLDDDGHILIGQAAKERLETHPLRTAAVFKRGMASTKSYALGSKHFRAEELSALVLKSLKADVEAHLKQTVNAAVVTVPAYFSDAQRQATRNSGLLAGFEVVHLLNEPTAAALAYGLHQKNEETQFLVFDFGGGTFDVSILEMFEGVMEVRATAGDNQLGGEDVDELMEAAFLKATACPTRVKNDGVAHAQLRARIERAKKSLSSAPEAEVTLAYDGQSFRHVFVADDLEAMLQPLLQRLRTPVETAMRDARIPAKDIHAIVLAGGSTRLRVVRSLVTRLFGRFPEHGLNPDEVVALGAAVQAGLIAQDAALIDRVMTDVCPYTLGIQTSRELTPGQHTDGFMSPILERNTIIPASRVQRYWTVADHQKILRIAVYQGEGRRVSDNIKLGEFDLPVPQGPRGEAGAEVRFTYDNNGLLEVEAAPVLGHEVVGVPRRLVIEQQAERLTPKQVAERLAKLQALKVHPRDGIKARTVLARSERLYRQLLGYERDLLAHHIAQYETVLDSQDERKINPVEQALIDHMDQIESHNLLGGD